MFKKFQNIFLKLFDFSQFLKQQVEFVNDQMTRSDELEGEGSRPIRRKKQRQAQAEQAYNEPSAVEQSQMKYDSTGMYHW